MNTVFDTIKEHFPPVVLYMNDIPNGFVSHEIHGYLQDANSTGVILFVPWDGNIMRTFQFSFHAIIAMELSTETVLKEMGLAE